MDHTLSEQFDRLVSDLAFAGMLFGRLQKGNRVLGTASLFTHKRDSVRF